MALKAFAEALDAANSGRGKRRPVHVLLGNGFSRACKDDIFAYGALFDRADFRALSRHVPAAFASLATRDFEKVMRALRDSAQLIRVYEPAGGDLANAFEADAAGLREVLVQAIAGSHPDLPGDISADAYAACKRFLAHFDRIVTVNYDLLLYWALMQAEVTPQVRSDDGFRKPDREADYVTWEPDHSYDQNVYYLHGALHLFDSGTEIQKYTWINTGVRLIDQIRTALAAGLYPMFVAEGSSGEKVERIRHNAYLSKAERSLLNLGGSLFVYGLSLADNDAHILNAILRSKIDRVYVSVYGDTGTDANREIMKRAKSLEVDGRGKGLLVDFYDAASAQVWG